MRPNFQVQEQHTNLHGFWDPPNIRTAYIRSPPALYRWAGGRVLPVAGSDQVQLHASDVFRAATMFTQRPGTGHLLAVNFDAERKTVRESGGWRPLSFDHKRIDATNRVVSLISPAADEAQLPAPCSNGLTQLLPSCYHWQAQPDQHGHSVPCPDTSAGLAGKLPILIAIAAFSAPEAQVRQALMTCIQPRGWQRHQYANGRSMSIRAMSGLALTTSVDDEHRGLVVTIYYDRSNQRSTKANLEKLENGGFGCFYR